MHRWWSHDGHCNRHQDHAGYFCDLLLLCYERQRGYIGPPYLQYIIDRFVIALLTEHSDVAFSIYAPQELFPMYTITKFMNVQIYCVFGWG